MSETVKEFRQRRRRLIERLTPDTFKAICATLPQHTQDAVQNQLEAIYAHGWLDCYREMKGAYEKAHNTST